MKLSRMCVRVEAWGWRGRRDLKSVDVREISGWKRQVRKLGKMRAGAGGVDFCQDSRPKNG